MPKRRIIQIDHCTRDGRKVAVSRLVGGILPVRTRFAKGLGPSCQGIQAEQFSNNFGQARVAVRDLVGPVDLTEDLHFETVTA